MGSLHHMTTIQTKLWRVMILGCCHKLLMSRMPPTKFVLKCGNFAVLVDLHVLPSGSGEEASWSAEQHKEEVSEMIRDVVDQRVRHFLETRHQKGQPKPKKGLTPTSPLCIKGERFRLAAYFMKRHVNLRCVGRRQQGELRVFPERVVVCASVPEDAAERGGPGNLTAMEHGGQSESEYFSGHRETEDPLNSSAIAKRNTLQKIAKKAGAQARSNQRGGGLSAPMETEAGGGVAREEELGVVTEEAEEDGGDGAQTSTGAPAPEGTARRIGPQSGAPRGEGPRPQEGGERAKRVCFGQAPASCSEVVAETRPAKSSSQTAQTSPLALRSHLPLGLDSGPSPPALGPSPPALGHSPPALGPSPPTLGPSPPALGPSPPAPGKGPKGQKPGPRPLLPQNRAQASREGRAGGDGNASFQHSEAKPPDAQQGGENRPRKSRLKRVRKA
ncbi:protein SLX4IP isoform X1 [Conger conger]|uniref:protein SLX4IP isoform X1 n=2 Tax=Conger conger TaxID=82655 RepID=UPI002A5A99B5|nr:protein SLX4IP isoform X1 [Conger conger]